MSISKLGGTNSDNWELISSVTPTAATAAVNFTGLGVYRKFLVRWTGIVLNASESVYVRLNNDSSSANYAQQYQTPTATVYADTNAAFYFQSSSANHKGYAIFESCDTASIKTLTNGAGGSSSLVYAQAEGFYLGSAVISQINVVTGSTFTAVGTVALYGVK